MLIYILQILSQIIYDEQVRIMMDHGHTELAYIKGLGMRMIARTHHITNHGISDGIVLVRHTDYIDIIIDDSFLSASYHLDGLILTKEPAEKFQRLKLKEHGDGVLIINSHGYVLTRSTAGEFHNETIYTLRFEKLGIEENQIFEIFHYVSEPEISNKNVQITTGDGTRIDIHANNDAYSHTHAHEHSIEHYDDLLDDAHEMSDSKYHENRTLNKKEEQNQPFEDMKIKEENFYKYMNFWANNHPNHANNEFAWHHYHHGKFGNHLNNHYNRTLHHDDYDENIEPGNGFTDYKYRAHGYHNNYLSNNYSDMLLPVNHQVLDQSELNIGGISSQKHLLNDIKRQDGTTVNFKIDDDINNDYMADVNDHMESTTYPYNNQILNNNDWKYANNINSRDHAILNTINGDKYATTSGSMGNDIYTARSKYSNGASGLKFGGKISSTGSSSMGTSSTSAGGKTGCICF